MTVRTRRRSITREDILPLAAYEAVRAALHAATEAAHA